MKVLFGFQEVIDVIENGFQPLVQGASDAQKATHKEMKKQDSKAMFILHQCVDDIHFEKIGNETTSKEAWDIIVKSH